LILGTKTKNNTAQYGNCEHTVYLQAVTDGNACLTAGPK